MSVSTDPHDDRTSPKRVSTMNRRENWKPSKYVLRNGRLRASRDRREVNAASRVSADCFAKFLQQGIQNYARGRLADLGCGKAPLYEVYRPLVDDVICADWNGSIHELSYVDIHCDLNAELPFADESFDTVLLTDVLEHVRNPQRLIREIRRILAIDGRALVSVPFCYGLHETPFDFYRFTEYALVDLAESHGLSVVQLVPTGGAPAVLVDITSKVVQRIPVVGRPTCAILQACAGFMLRHWPLNLATRLTERVFPLGYFAVFQRSKAASTK